MIGYVTVGSNDFAKSLPFYDALMSEMGASPIFDHPRGGRMYGKAPGKFDFGVISAYNGDPPHRPAMAQWSRLRRTAMTRSAPSMPKALELGATDEGEPGWRGRRRRLFRRLFPRSGWQQIVRLSHGSGVSSAAARG